MAIVNINYDCGCGFHTKTVEEAIKHVDASKHTLNVAGLISSPERKAPRVTASSPISTSLRPRTMKKAPTTAPAEEQIESKIDFSNLRARLHREKE